MSALEQVFRSAGGPLFMPYAVGGFPDFDSSLEIVRVYRESGAELIEMGIPFSDPLADGPVIQSASQVALSNGIRPHHVLELAAAVSAEGARVVLLSYLNTILAFGTERFFDTCRDSGVLGVVIPDLPVEEAAELRRLAGARGVDVVLLAAPTSTESRLARIGGAASGFIYCVSTTGVTGARSALNTDLPAFLSRLRLHTSLPLAVGFGVSTAEQAAAVATYADGVIVGSALVDVAARSRGPEEARAGLRTMLADLRKAVKGTALAAS